MATSVASGEHLVAEVIDNGQVSGQQLLVVGLCLFFNMLDGFDITAMAVVAVAVSSELSLTPDRPWLGVQFCLTGHDVWCHVHRAHFGRCRQAQNHHRQRSAGRSRRSFYGQRIQPHRIYRPEIYCRCRVQARCWPVLQRSQRNTGPGKYRALSVAAVTSGYPLGAMFTSVAAGVILPEYGWRGMFWFGGGLTLIMGLVGWVLIPESLKYLFERRPANALVRVNTILAKLKREPLASLPVAANAQADKAGFVATLLKLLNRAHARITLTLWSAFFLCFATLYFLMSWIPKLMVDAGFGDQAGNQAFFLFNLGGVIGIFLLGILSTRWKLTNLVFLLLVSSAVGMIGFAMAPQQVDLLLAVIFVIGLLLQGGFTGLYGSAAKAYPTEIRSTGIGWAIGLGRSGAVVGPAAAGYLIAAGFDMSANFFIFAVPMAIGGFIAYRLHIH